jgi:CBS domain containing-hemolysin-like protein
LVGEIEDEHDAVTEDIVLFGPDEAVVGAKERIEEVNEQLVVNLPNDQYDTVGGLITGLANRIPQIGEVYEINGVALTVEEGDDRNIERVRITVAHRDGGES